jgi:hypothetical protein
MESWGWEKSLELWSQEEKNLLKEGWRSAYKSAWTRWCQWCREKNIDPSNPNGSQLGRFLANLKITKNLSSSTIALHKSVICSWTNPNNQSKLSEHKLVKQVMRGITNSSKKKEPTPIWDPGQVVTWLQNNPPKTMTLFDVSRRCAVILLLASGRRVHDLTLLRNTPERFIDNGDHIIMWPVFGSKTDSLTHHQSGWKLNASRNKATDPTYWLRKLLELSKERRQRAGNISNLFILQQVGQNLQREQ